MEQVGMNQVANIQKIQNQPTTQPSFTSRMPIEQKEDGDKKLMNALAGLAVIGAGGLAIYDLTRKGDASHIKKFFGKFGKKATDEVAQAATKGADDVAQAGSKAVTKGADDVAQAGSKAVTKGADDVAIAPKTVPSSSAGVKAAQGAAETVSPETAKITAPAVSEAKKQIPSKIDIEAEELRRADLELEAATGPKANKSARDSALVFYKAEKQEIRDEVARRTKEEATIRQARKAQNNAIAQMQNPSGKSAADSAMVFMEADYASSAKELKQITSEMEDLKTKIGNTKNKGKLRKLNRRLNALSDKFYVVSDHMYETEKVMNKAMNNI